MELRPLRLLVLEDSAPDAELMIRPLKQAGITCEWKRVATEAEFIAALDSDIDVILADYRLSGFTALAALQRVKEMGLDTPFIVVTGTLPDDLAVECIREGAADFLLKDRLARLPEAVRRALTERQLRREKRQAEIAYREQEAHYRLLFDLHPHPMWVFDMNNLRFLSVNQAAVRQYGYTQEEFRKMTVLDIRPVEDQQKFVNYLETHRDNTGSVMHGGVWRHCRKDGGVFDVQVSWTFLHFLGNPVMLVLGEDVTERRNLEAQLRQAQKMEAVGRLAGSVAHDFNNLLTVIKGYSQLLLAEMPRESPWRAEVDHINLAADRAASLTRQLLAFSRRQVLQPTVLQLNDLLKNLGKLLRRLIGEDIELATEFAPDLGHVKADPGQLEQVIMNLAVNARDAMPHGGELALATANVTLQHPMTVNGTTIPVGAYVVMTVRDTGTGMTQEVQARLFEPFFTTKEKGKGTGLGLSTVYGIVTQSGGYIAVSSAVGQGTVFSIYLPRVNEQLQHPDRIPSVTPTLHGTETILLVEDQALVRTFARHVLDSQGYTVLEASDGVDALNIAREHKQPIHLLVADVVMPRLNGPAVAVALAETHPETKTLFVSGYTDDTVTPHGVLEPGVAYLPKPYSPDALAQKVREILDLPSGK